MTRGMTIGPRSRIGSAWGHPGPVSRDMRRRSEPGPRQTDVLMMIHERFEGVCYSLPTLAADCGMPARQLNKIVVALVDRGLLYRRPNIEGPGHRVWISDRGRDVVCDILRKRAS